MLDYDTDSLHSTDTMTIARTLSDMQIDIIKADNSLGGEAIGKRLEKLRNAVWNSNNHGDGSESVTDNKLRNNEESQRRTFEKAIDGLDKEQVGQLLASYARMGHIYDIAALAARSNYIAKIRNDGNQRKIAPGGVEEVIQKNSWESVEGLVEKLNTPVFEIVMTAHPTNVNSLSSMKAQREINKALEGRNGKALRKAIVKYEKTPLIDYTEDSNGGKRVTNLTVHDETKTALYFLGNLYEDLPRAYETYDDALAKCANEKHSKYDPASLALNVRLGSWASAGDKDGNNNVTADCTLEAIALHTQAILARYNEDIGKTRHPELARWKAEFDVALTKLDPLVDSLSQLCKDMKEPNNTSIELNERFDKLSAELAKIRGGLDREGFESDLKLYARDDRMALDLLRRFRTFGFEFAKIEYRETAKEYGRVVGGLVDGYSDLSPEQKVNKLTEILQQPDNVAARLRARKETEIVNGGAGKPYTDSSAYPISYHTLKRMALARDFGNIIKDNVLAECGQLEFPREKVRKPTEAETVAQGVANILEAVFLQNAVEKNGSRAVMGVVPLFEEPTTMTYIDRIMGASYNNEAYGKHIEAVQKENKMGRPTQQVMIAHSDNARRAGLQAARAYIHEAHHKVRALNEERKRSGDPDISIQFFEGGSVSDAYRNGVRALSASVNAFGLHDFSKFTFQGGDLLNYFNHPDSTSRLIDRQISHQVGLVGKDSNKEWVARIVGVGHRYPDTIAIDALKGTLGDYQERDFTENAMGVLLSALEYDKTVRDSNAGSRAGARGGVSQVKTSIGAAAVGSRADKETTFKPIPIEKVRTIGFSKAWQGSGVVPSFIGSGTLRDELNTANRVNRSGIDSTTLQHDNDLMPSDLRLLYMESPTFRDAQDRSAFAIALTDMDAAKRIAMKNLDIDKKKDSGATIMHKQRGHEYLERVQDTYRKAAELSYSSQTGKALYLDNATNRMIRHEMIEALPHLRDDIVNKSGYRAFLLHLQAEHPEVLEDNYIGRVAQAAKDTVEHGRWLAASDPTYARHVTAQSRHHTGLTKQ